MSSTIRAASFVILVLGGIPLLGNDLGSLSAQAPTLPSDTLEANFAPPSGVAPMPEKAPSLPSDTIQIGAPLDTTGLILGEPEKPKAKRRAANPDSTSDSTSQY
jgi:hypothetical protein